MMKNDLLVNKSIVHMNIFFPATASRIRRLYSAIETADDPDAIVDRILKHFDERDIEFESAARKAADDLLDHRTAFEEMKKQYQSGKKANGVPIRKDQLPEWRKKVHKLEEKWRADKRVYDLNKNQQKKLSQNRILLLSLNGRC